MTIHLSLVKRCIGFLVLSLGTDRQPCSLTAVFVRSRDLSPFSAFEPKESKLIAAWHFTRSEVTGGDQVLRYDSSGQRAATERGGRLDRAIDGVRRAGPHGPAGLAERPVPPFAGVVGEAGARQGTDQ